MAVLGTKIHRPVPRTDLVLRPRLTDALVSPQRPRMVLIAAPVGFGKTTLLGQWLATDDNATDVAWLSLDADDNDPRRFLSPRGCLEAVFTRPGDLPVATISTIGALARLMNRPSDFGGVQAPWQHGEVLADEPNRSRPAAPVSARFARHPRSGTKPEMALRRALFAAGLRFRVQVKVPGNNRRTVDIAFSRAKLAVFVDGCFWHGCPEHFPLFRKNAEWWRWKVETNRARDADTERLLREAGWDVVRVWEHEDVASAVDRVVDLWRESVRER